MNGGWCISHEIALRWMPLDLTDDKSTLVQVMAWCRQATSHYLSQCSPRSMSPNGVTGSQWVKGVNNGVYLTHSTWYKWFLHEVLITVPMKIELHDSKKGFSSQGLTWGATTLPNVVSKGVYEAIAWLPLTTNEGCQSANRMVSQQK